jgi:hypothetical protein
MRAIQAGLPADATVDLVAEPMSLVAVLQHSTEDMCAEVARTTEVTTRLHRLRRQVRHLRVRTRTLTSASACMCSVRLAFGWHASGCACMCVQPWLQHLDLQFFVFEGVCAACSV